MNRHTTKENEAWVMHTSISWWVVLYDIFTRMWFYRWGKIYFSDKVCKIISGKAELISEQNWLEVREILSPKMWEKIILSGIPHVFYFHENCRMLEWFPEWTKSEEFKKYRNMKK